MKRITSIVLVLVMMVSLFAIPTSVFAKDIKFLVAESYNDYITGDSPLGGAVAGGKTKVVAETLAVNLRCDICQIKDMKKRDGIRNRFTSTIDAFRESKTEIYPPTLDLEEYDTIYIGTPTWANNPTPAIITLIDRCDLRGKDIVLFTTTSTSDGESALEKMEMKVRARGARVVQQFSVKTKDKSLDALQKDTDRIFMTLDLALY